MVATESGHNTESSHTTGSGHNIGLGDNTESGHKKRCHPERSEGSAVDFPSPSNHQPVLLAHSLYKRLLSPILHAAATTLGLTSHCRFQPTCSDYATLAPAQHGPLRGSLLALGRLLRCHPFSRGGWDPVPPVPPRKP